MVNIRMLLPKDQRSGHVTGLKSYFSHANTLSFKIRKLHCHEHKQVTMLFYSNIGAWKLTVIYNIGAPAFSINSQNFFWGCRCDYTVNRLPNFPILNIYWSFTSLRKSRLPPKFNQFLISTTLEPLPPNRISSQTDKPTLPKT